jgi:hypothetical protein
MEWVGTALTVVVFGVSFVLIRRREQRLNRPKEEMRPRARAHILASLGSYALIILSAVLEFWPLLVVGVGSLLVFTYVLLIRR